MRALQSDSLVLRSPVVTDWPAHLIVVVSDVLLNFHLGPDRLSERVVVGHSEGE